MESFNNEKWLQRALEAQALKDCDKGIMLKGNCILSQVREIKSQISFFNTFTIFPVYSVTHSLWVHDERYKMRRQGKFEEIKAQTVSHKKITEHFSLKC